MGGMKQHAGGEVSSDHGSAATGDSGRGPSEDSVAPATAVDGTAVSRVFCRCIDDTSLNNNNNKKKKNDNIYGAVIVAQSHCESSPGSYDEYGTAPSSRQPSDQAKRPGL